MTESNLDAPATETPTDTPEPALDAPDGPNGGMDRVTLMIDGEAVDFAPSHIPEAFWDKETNQLKTEAWAKAWIDTQKMAREKAPEAPTAYESHRPEGIDTILQGDDDPLLVGFTETAKALNLTQAQHNGVIDMYVQLAQQMQADNTPDPAAKEAALKQAFGNNAPQTERASVDYARSVAGDDADMNAVVDVLAESHEGIRFLNRLRNSGKFQTPQGLPPEPQPSLLEQFQASMHTEGFRQRDPDAIKLTDSLREQLEAQDLVAART